MGFLGSSAPFRMLQIREGSAGLQAGYRHDLRVCLRVLEFGVAANAYRAEGNGTWLMACEILELTQGIVVVTPSLVQCI